MTNQQNDYQMIHTERPHNESYGQVMREKTNNSMQNQVEILDSGKGNQINKEGNQQKLDVYYRTSPLNVIHETWELESKASGLHESQSQKKFDQDYQSNENRRTSLDQQMKRLALNQSQQSLNSHRGNVSEQESVKSKQSEKKEKVEAIKSRLKQLFLNYCDYSIDNGETFITYTNFMKVVRDAQILDEQRVNQNIVSILISKECNSTANMIKHITFEQFLNTILRISELKYSELFKKYPKSALKALLQHNILPLLLRIERAVENQSDDLQYSLYTVSELTLKLIIYNEDTQVIFSDILPLIKTMYHMYFEQEVNNSKGKKDDLKKLSLKSVMAFTRDFELSPYLVHQKACFLIWYSVAHSKSKQELANNPDLRSIIAASQNIGKQFTLSHFIMFIYRLAVIYFNHSQEKPQDYNLIKKLLFFLRKLENSDGFKKFMSKLNRTYNDSLTFLPSKDLLCQILKAENVEDFPINNPEEYQYITKEAMISRIVDKHLYEGVNFLEDQQDQVQNDEAQEYVINIEYELKKIFEIYCAFGEPMNTKYLKSSKLYKMFRESGLIKGQSRLPKSAGNGKQISMPEMDLAFKYVSARSQVGGQGIESQFQSCMTVNALGESQHVSGFIQQYQSQMMLSKIRGGKTMNNSQYYSNSSQMKTSSFQQSSYLIDRTAPSTGRIDFLQFKKVLEIIGSKVYSDISQQFSYVQLIKNILIPQLRHMNDKRCVHNQLISQLLLKLDNQDMINLLTLLHKSMIDIYKVYADQKGYMNFSQYINFCSDFDIFPDVSTKATLYRIYHSLSFMNEVLGQSTQKSIMMKQQSQMSSKFSRVNSPTNRSGIPQQQQQSFELIDEHLFVESLALIALYNDEVSSHKLRGQGDEKVSEEFPNEEAEFGKVDIDLDEDVNETTPIEKVLQLVEKMANAEGLYKKIRKGDTSNAIKCNLMDKKDILEVFRYKYPTYFRNRYIDASAIKKKNFDDIMEMSSIMTEASQFQE